MPDSNRVVDSPWSIVNLEGYPDLFEVKVNIEDEQQLPFPFLFQEINQTITSLDLRANEALSERDQRAQELKHDLLKNLRALVERTFEKSTQSEKSLLVRFGRYVGRYEEQIHDLMSPEFVSLFPNDHDPTDLRLSENVKEIPSDSQAVLVDIYRAKTVVNIVFERRAREATRSATAKNVKALYLKELRDIGQVAADSAEGAAHAQIRLAAFRDSFLAREAEIVKNQHVRRLGVYCALFGSLALIPAGCVLYFGTPFANDTGSHAVFIMSLMVAASSAGTWLSFSLRKVFLTYGDLAGLEEDRLDAGGRVIFVMILTAVLGLILFAGFFTISAGTTRVTFTGPDAPSSMQQAFLALLIGIFAGIAERSLSGLVVKQATGVLGAPERSTTS